MEQNDINLIEQTHGTILPCHVHKVFAKATCLYSKAEVEAALDRMANQISHKVAHSNPIFLCVVVGGIVPLGNLLLRLDFPLEVDYIHVTRYRKNIIGKQLTWRATPETALKDRTLVVVDDILDAGITLKAILEYCYDKEAKKVYSAILVDKKDARDPSGLSAADFCGLKVENHYVFGFGMDYKGYLRNAPGIYRVAAEHE